MLMRLRDSFVLIFFPRFISPESIVCCYNPETDFFSLEMTINSNPIWNHHMFAETIIWCNTEILFVSLEIAIMKQHLLRIVLFVFLFVNLIETANRQSKRYKRSCRSTWAPARYWGFDLTRGEMTSLLSSVAVFWNHWEISDFRAQAHYLCLNEAAHRFAPTTPQVQSINRHEKAQ
jgi:hypothetical protein